MIAFTIPGAPPAITAQQKGVNFGSRRFYTKPAIKDEHHRLTLGMLAALRRRPTQPLSGPLICDVLTVHPLNRTLARRHADRLSDPTFLLPHPEKPDADNHAKLLLDAISDFGIWEDDKQVCDLILSKRYGSEPRIEVRIWPWSGTPG